jgi:hypothetical protein
MPLVLGEFGARDQGDNSVRNADTTVYTPEDRRFLTEVGPSA